jgi:hypothetical protein
MDSAITHQAAEPRHDYSGSPVVAPTCHDVIVDQGFEISNVSSGREFFFVILYMYIDEIRAVTVSKDVLVIASKVLRVFKGLDPPGRFLVTGVAGRVVASPRTGLRVTLQCFKTLRSAGSGRIEVARRGVAMVATNDRQGVEVGTVRRGCILVLILFLCYRFALLYDQGCIVFAISWLLGV